MAKRINITAPPRMSELGRQFIAPEQSEVDIEMSIEANKKYNFTIDLEGIDDYSPSASSTEARGILPEQTPTPGSEPVVHSKINLGELGSKVGNSEISYKKKSIPLNLVKILKWLNLESKGKQGVWIRISQTRMKEIGVTHRLLFKDREIGRTLNLLDYKVEFSNDRKMETWYCLGEEKYLEH